MQEIPNLFFFFEDVCRIVVDPYISTLYEVEQNSRFILLYYLLIVCISFIDMLIVVGVIIEIKKQFNTRWI